VLDRLIQQAICQVLLPVFDPHFSESSFGFRPGHSAHDAVYQVRKYIRNGIPLPEINHWLRRRVRMCYLKRWRWCRTKVCELTKLGTNLRLAISIGLSRKGPYRLAKTLATQSGMTNKWLKDQGLLSVKELWVNIHYPATAR